MYRSAYSWKCWQAKRFNILAFAWSIFIVFCEIFWNGWCSISSLYFIKFFWSKSVTMEKKTKSTEECLLVSIIACTTWTVWKINIFICRRFIIFATCALAYSSLWVSYLYFNAEVTDSTGETIKFRDAVVNFFTSPLWRDLKQSLQDLLRKFWTQGWDETWKQLMNDLDPLGEQQALKVNFYFCRIMQLNIN